MGQASFFDFVIHHLWQSAFLLFAVSVGLFAWVMLCKRRTLWSGATFLGMMAHLAVTMFCLLTDYADYLAAHRLLLGIIIGVYILAMVFILALPLMLVGIFFIEGVKMVRHEGVSASHLLSLLFAVLLALYLCLYPAIANSGNMFTTKCYSIIRVGVVYVLALLVVYVLSAMLNLLHLQKGHNADYIVILGAGLAKDKVTPLLAGRLDVGLALLKDNPHALLILSGGQGDDEAIAEGEAMALYVKERGVSDAQIIIENRSRSTQENIAFSQSLMTKENPMVLVVTSAYHVFRALLIAKEQGISCLGFGAKTAWYFTLNALMREFVGYLQLSWRKHAPVVILLALVAVIA